MQLIETVNAMQTAAAEARAAGRTIGLVPTMGALHEGHLSLVDNARGRADLTVVSLFVNPTQFGPNEDFDRYPRQREADLDLLRARGVDVVFAPAPEEIYPSDYSVFVVEESLSKGLCGISRPVFFRGVCTVVAKLFNIVGPHLAVFGQKDAQQAAVIKKMVRDLHIPVEVVVGPTVREPDGLAMSSRNAYLSEAGRGQATALYAALQKAEEMVAGGSRNPDRVAAEITHLLAQQRLLRVIYVSIVDPDTMEPRREIVPGSTLVALAAWCNEVRLIDNVLV